MKPALFEYVRAESIQQALEELARGDCQPLAGGQSLIPAMNFRLAAPGRLIDLGGLQQLRGLRVVGNDVVAGAMTRHRDFETDANVRRLLPMLPHALTGVAHVPIRNRGTIGGSLAHADPAGDWPALCLACDTSMTLRRIDGERSVSAAEFQQGLFETAIEPGELLTEIRFPGWPPGRRWGVEKLTRRHGDFAIVGVIALLDLDADGVCQWARIVLQAVTDTPLVATTVQDLLLGQRPDAQLLQRAGEAAQAAVQPRSDLHASSEYRSELVAVLTRRALQRALAPDPGAATGS